jgi:hypothetical protein
MPNIPVTCGLYKPQSDSIGDEWEIWSIGRIIQQKTEVLGEKNLSKCHFGPHNSDMVQPRAGASMVRESQQNTWFLAWPVTCRSRPIFKAKFLINCGTSRLSSDKCGLLYGTAQNSSLNWGCVQLVFNSSPLIMALFCLFFCFFFIMSVIPSYMFLWTLLVML